MSSEVWIMNDCQTWQEKIIMLSVVIWKLPNCRRVGLENVVALYRLRGPMIGSETNWRLCLTESQQSERWDALQRKYWVDWKKCFDFSLFIGERGVKFFYKAEYCDTPQSKERRNGEYKVCLNDRALRLLDHCVTWKSGCFPAPERGDFSKNSGIP